MSLKMCLALIARLACCSTLLKADILIVQAVDIDINGKAKSIERKIYLKNNRMRIESLSTDQHTATIIDLDQHTITQIDLAKGSGTVYQVGKLHDYVSNSASGPISASVGPESGMLTLADTKCGKHSFELAIPAFRDTGARVVARGSACLANEGPANQEYSAFLAKALNEGVVINYVSDNAVLMALAREQTELYRLLSTRGGIPLSLDLSTHFEGGIIGKMWNVAASHSTLTTKSISTFPLGAGVIEVPASITPTRKDH